MHRPKEASLVYGDTHGTFLYLLTYVDRVTKKQRMEMWRANDELDLMIILEYDFSLRPGYGIFYFRREFGKSINFTPFISLN